MAFIDCGQYGTYHQRNGAYATVCPLVIFEATIEAIK